MIPSLARALPLVLLLAASVVLSGCGFQPLYGTPQTSATLASVSLAPIPEKEGQALTLLLEDRFYGATPPAASPQWSLAVTFSSAKQDLGIRRDDTATRARLILRADITIRRLDAAPTAPPVYAGTERSFVGYNILSDPYATLAAEDNAMTRGLVQLADSITRRVALTLAAPAPTSFAPTSVAPRPASGHETQVR